MAGKRHSDADHKRIRGARTAARTIDSLMAELGDDDYEAGDEEAAKTVKALSLNDQISLVSRAVCQAAGPLLEMDCWIDEVFADSAIVCVGGRYYQASYTIDETGTVLVQPRVEWVEVEETYTPVAARSIKAVLGGAVKALGDGRVGGPLITFGGVDLEGTYFEADTYFGPADGDGCDCYFHHAIPVRAELAHLAAKPIGNRLKISRSEAGLFAETVLNMADEYEAAIYELAAAGKLGWSSGSAGHLVRVAGDGKISAWPIIEGSLTPSPAEPRNRASIRTFTRPQGRPQGAGDAPAASEPSIVIKTSTGVTIL